MDFRLLGPLEVRDDDGQLVDVGARQQRLLLAVLLLDANHVVSLDRLIDVLWGERAPSSAVKSVQVHISRLRRTLTRGSGTRIHTRPSGYLLEVARDELDVSRFSALVDEGRHALAAGDSGTAAGILRAADAEWRGPPLADFAYESFARDESARLDELRLGAAEDRIDADLALGRHAEITPELQQLVNKHPLRERLRGQLMLALHRAGRKAEALAAYDDGRRLLAEELGLEPGEGLRRLQHGILNDDADLSAPARPPARKAARPARARPLLAAGGLLLVAAAVAAGLLLATSATESARIASIAPDSLGAIDPKTKHLVADIPGVATPTGVAVVGGDLWVANPDQAIVQRVDPDTGRVVATVPTAEAPMGLVGARGALWAIRSDGVVLKIDPRYDKIVARIPTIAKRDLPHGAPLAGALTATDDAVWALSGGSGTSARLFRIDAATKKRRSFPILGDGPTAIASGFGDLWVTDSFDNTVARVDPSGVVIASIPVGRGATAVAVGENAVWVVDSLDDAVVRIDPATNSVTDTIPVRRFPTAVAVGGGYVWVTNLHGGSVSRIDPETTEGESIAVGAGPAGAAFADGSLWFTTQENPPPSAPSGDVLRVTTSIDFATDPAFADPHITYATCAKLLSYPDKAGREGTRLVPEAAAAMPTVSDDGRTYTFAVRDGFAFSPPLHEEVTAETFRHSIERSLDPRANPLAAALVRDIVGADRYRAGKAQHVSGIVVRGDELSITLVEPDPSFLHRIAGPWFCAVPLETPIERIPLRAIPSAGPYYVASERRGRSIVLRRNPNYHGQRPRRFREIEITMGINPSTGVADVIAGRSDYLLDNPPVERDAELLTRYGPASAAARGGAQQYFANPTLALAFLELNTRRPLFSDVRLRKAVNHAVDRRALARLGTFISGPFPSIPTQQYLPPALPSASRTLPYPPAGDLRAARRLTPRVRQTAVLYTCSDIPDVCRRPAELVKQNLAPLGLAIDIKEFPYPEQFLRAARPGEPWDILIAHWGLDYPDPAAVLDERLDAASVGPELAARLERARRLAGEARDAAYRSLSADIARDAAPWVVYALGGSRDLFSARVGCQLFHPVYQIDLAALCRRG